MPTLTVLQGPDRGRTYQLTVERTTLLGRGSEAAPLTDNTVSRRHAELRASEGFWELVDLKSANGTLLNGKRVERPTRLKHGDQIRIGSTLIIWIAEEPIRRLPPGMDAARDLVELDDSGKAVDTAIIGSVGSFDDSVIMASPVASDAVRAWRVLSQLTELIAAVPTQDQLLERIMDILFEELPIDRGFILMRDERDGELLPHVVRYRGHEEVARISTSRTLIEHVLAKREGILCTNALSDERFDPDVRSGSIQAFNIQSVICAPIIARDEPLGVIHIDTRVSTQTYTEQQLRLVVSIGRMSGLAIEDAQLVAARMRTERLAATGETVAALSHYIKNILQGLRSGADVVEMGLSRQQLGTIDQGWQIVQRNLDKIFSLTMNMLAYSKTREPRLEPTRINKVVKDAVDLARRRAEDKAVLLKTDFDDRIPPVPIDSDGIHQVVLNLVANAIDAVPKSTGVINVRTRLDEPAGDALVSVADNGPGMPPAIIQHGFEPFFSTKGQGGTGLGLAVARKIVQEHRGTIDVRSEPSAGTIITVRLPLAAPSTTSDATIGPA